MRRSFAVKGLVLGLLTALLVPSVGFGRHARSGGQWLVPRIDRDQHDLGDRRRLHGDAHAGRLHVPGDRLLAREERGHGRREDPHELLDRRLMFWACGFALAFGAPVSDSFNVFGDKGFFLQGFGDPATAFPVIGIFDVTVEAKFFFQFVFCAVSLAIVWGTTLERIKFGVYIIYSVVFAGADLPARRPLGVRRWLPAERRLARHRHRRHAGLRRLDGGPPHRCDRRAGGAAAARPAQGQVRPRRQAAGDPGPQHAAVRPGRS